MDNVIFLIPIRATLLWAPIDFTFLWVQSFETVAHGSNSWSYEPKYIETK